MCIYKLAVKFEQNDFQMAYYIARNRGSTKCVAVTIYHHHHHHHHLCHHHHQLHHLHLHTTSTSTIATTTDITTATFISQIDSSGALKLEFFQDQQRVY